ncbi:hypothetical protein CAUPRSCDRAFT_11220 [Caulochytrium protostelioides]|uniref:Uncharacterized protein n=1 Tax=Caulochytrium protostelioides TaxID=1555241 RepID=A0A4P9WZQ7_9FUNG|nr:hypothetical protein CAUPRSCDRAFT_11220 [Caulochytrium protostelioides]
MSSRVTGTPELHVADVTRCFAGRLYSSDGSSAEHPWLSQTAGLLSADSSVRGRQTELEGSSHDEAREQLAPGANTLEASYGHSSSTILAASGQMTQIERGPRVIPGPAPEPSYPPGEAGSAHTRPPKRKHGCLSCQTQPATDRRGRHKRDSDLNVGFFCSQDRALLVSEEFVGGNRITMNHGRRKLVETDRSDISSKHSEV